VLIAVRIAHIKYAGYYTMVFRSEINFRNNICGSNIPYRRAPGTEDASRSTREVKVLAERLPVKMWVPVLALLRALDLEDILPWILSTSPAVVCARDAYNIRTIFVGNNSNAENRCIVFCGPDCADAVDEARIINDAELLAAAVTTDDSKCKRVQRWLARTPTAVAARPAASTKRARVSHGAAAPPLGVAGGAAAAASPSHQSTRGAPFSSGRRRRAAGDDRARDEVGREFDTTRRRLVDTDFQTRDGDGATRLRVTEARSAGV
jgi:hypothetical protein